MIFCRSIKYIFCFSLSGETSGMSPIHRNMPQKHVDQKIIKYIYIYVVVLVVGFWEVVFPALYLLWGPSPRTLMARVLGQMERAPRHMSPGY